MNTPAELIARARGLRHSTVPITHDLIDRLCDALETSEKALAEAKAGESYAYAELAKLRHELVTYKRDVGPLVRAAAAVNKCDCNEGTMCGAVKDLLSLIAEKGTK